MASAAITRHKHAIFAIMQLIDAVRIRASQNLTVDFRAGGKELFVLCLLIPRDHIYLLSLVGTNRNIK